MLAATMLCLASLAQPAPARPDAYRGVVVERGTGRPLAGVSILVVTNPQRDFGNGPAAVTDEQGRFDGLPAAAGDWVANDGRGGPALRLRASSERVWPWFLAGGDGKPVDVPATRKTGYALNLYEKLVRTRWKGNGAEATLIVECPPVGVVEAVVRGPDGKPLADAPIDLVPLGGWIGNGSGPLRFSGRTDHAGTFRIQSFEGPWEFGIWASGIGLGATGRIVVAGGKTSRPEIPPLARFARVEGRVEGAADAETFLEPASTTGSMFLNGQWPPSTRCDAEGRFALTVPPGDYALKVRRDARGVDYRAVAIRLGPGEILRDVLPKPAPPTPATNAEAARRWDRWVKGDADRTIPWIEGTIRDEQGRPLEGATVRAIPSGSPWFWPSGIETTTTGRDGRYRVEGPVHERMTRIAVLVASKGRPPLWASALAPDATMGSSKSELKPSRLDATMGSWGGTLAIRVVRDGVGVEGAEVRLPSLPGSSHFGDPAGQRPDPKMNEARDVAIPMAVADRDGVARFGNLAPGFYEPLVTEPEYVGSSSLPWWTTRPFRGIAGGIEVAAGGRVETTFALDSKPIRARFRLLGPDGAPVADRALSIVRLGGGGRSISTMGNWRGGEGSIELARGLWRIVLRYRDVEAGSLTNDDEPFFQAEAQVVVSPAVELAEPIEARAVRHELGSIKVRLLGLDGAPARGGVMVLSRFPNRNMQAASVDAEGWARFPDMPSGKYGLRGHVEGSVEAPRLRFGTGWPADEELTGQVAVLDRETTVEPGAETVVELRLAPVGYVRATLHAPAGRSPSDYVVLLASDDVPDKYSYSSGDGANHLFGPLPPGTRAFVARGRTWWREVDPGRGTREVVVRPGEVARVDLDGPAGASVDRPDANSAEPFAGLVMNGVAAYQPEVDAAPITVMMPNGETPAFGARAIFFPAGSAEPILTGVADADGRLTWSPLRGWFAGKGGDRPTPAPTSTIIAWAPGGGAVATAPTPGEPLRLVLPKPAGVSGRVAIDGAAVAGRDARIRVALVAEGKDAVAAALGRETIADADGRFRFPILVPGRYEVQAVRDEIWTSKPMPVMIEPGKDATVDLDIPAVGATIALELVDRAGAPIAADFAINRPGGGPLGDPTPIVGRTDDQGKATVRGLAAGAFKLTLDGDAEPGLLEVPPATAGAAPFNARLEVSRPGP